MGMGCRQELGITAAEIGTAEIVTAIMWEDSNVSSVG